MVASFSTDRLAARYRAGHVVRKFFYGWFLRRMIPLAKDQNKDLGVITDLICNVVQSAGLVSANEVRAMRSVDEEVRSRLTRRPYIFFPTFEVAFWYSSFSRFFFRYPWPTSVLLPPTILSHFSFAHRQAQGHRVSYAGVVEGQLRLVLEDPDQRKCRVGYSATDLLPPLPSYIVRAYSKYLRLLCTGDTVPGIILVLDAKKLLHYAQSLEALPDKWPHLLFRGGVPLDTLAAVFMVARDGKENKTWPLGLYSRPIHDFWKERIKSSNQLVPLKDWIEFFDQPH